MNTFCIETLGCKVNHYEGEQIAALLRSHGLVESDAAHADLRVVNSCSVTMQAAGKSRQTTRRLVRLPLLASRGVTPVTQNGAGSCYPEKPCAPAAPSSGAGDVSPATRADGGGPSPRRPRVIVTGCWATSDPDQAAALPGVDAVITHHGDVAAELERLLALWRLIPGREEQRAGRHAPADSPTELTDRSSEPSVEAPPGRWRNDGWMSEAGTPAGSRTAQSKADSPEKVNLQIYALSVERGSENPRRPVGTTRLPVLGERQTGRQRAFLKVQDGCDAHCTYCIIPRLRPVPWSKPVDDAVEEARRLVAAGHVEVVLTGVFLSAYGQATALRRRRHLLHSPRRQPLGELVESLCTRVPGLRRLRLSSLEPGDLTDELLAVLRDHPQVVPHFHLPLQSGSDALLKRMNRQYTRRDFLRMVDRVRGAFDRPALTTDVIVGFPGETDEDLARTAEVVAQSAFIHVHAFSYSPRPGTAAARWTNDFVRGPVVNKRIELLQNIAKAHSLQFRSQFIGEVVAALVEERSGCDMAAVSGHGRTERYFDVEFDHPDVRPGDFVRVRVDEVTPRSTRGTCLSVERPARGMA